MRGGGRSSDEGDPARAAAQRSNGFWSISSLPTLSMTPGSARLGSCNRSSRRSSRVFGIGVRRGASTPTRP